ncbi:MAG: response regulator transcription factor [Clostridiales bacterium]|nr:response regulator transcription factor [Clostridiales bacterium]
MATILIYEPNHMLAQRLCDSLKKEKYNAIRCDETDLNPTALKEEKAPLVILDAQMKWTVCRPMLETFSRRGCPILFLTGDRKMRAHLRALYAGNCDVLAAPFSGKALKTCVAHLLGQSAPMADLSLDETERVALLDGRRVELTAQEYALLLALMETPDTPVSREQLLRTAWGYQSMGETRTVDVHVQRLRKKLGNDYIETVYKCGYRLRLA